MKKLINAINRKATALAVNTRSILANRRAEGYVDTGVKVLMAVVIGALVLGGLYGLFADTIMPTVEAEIVDLFEFKG